MRERTERGTRTPIRNPQSAIRNPWPLILALGMGVFVGGFDQTFVVPVLSSILSDFNIPISEFGKASWIINGYLLGYTVAMPLMGRVADVYGHLRVFIASLLVFAGGSVLVALSPNLTALTLARAVTALGGGALVPIALAVTAGRLPPVRRPLGLSMVSTLDDASSLIGPLWGTLIGVWIGWRGLFWMNIVLGLAVMAAVIVLAHRADGRTPPVEPGPRAWPAAASRREARVDWLGGLLLAAGLTTLTYVLASAGTGSWNGVRDLTLYGASAVLFAGFVLRELRAGDPLIDLGMFRSLRLAAANAIFFLDGAAMIVALVNIPLMTEALWGRSGMQPGLMLMRMVLFMLAGGLAGGLLASRIGFRATAVAGYLIGAAGLFGMQAWPEQPSELARWVVLAVTGLGFTIPDAAIYATVINHVRTGRRASAAALLQVLQTTGMIIAMALLASEGLGQFNQRAADLFRESAFNITEAQYRTVMHKTFDETFFVAALLMAGAAVLSLLLEPGGSRQGRGALFGSAAPGPEDA